MLSASADADRGLTLPRLTTPRAIRVVHVVPRLRGGPETQVRRLCERLLEYNCNVTLVSVYPSELDPNDRSKLTVPLIELPQSGSALGRVQRLGAELRRLEPDIVQLHLDLGRFVGRFASLAAGGVPIVILTDDGGERGGGLRNFGDKLLSSWTSAFVVSTDEAKRQLIKSGIAEKKISVIPSGGIDAVANLQAAKKVRQDLGIGERDVAYILPARLAAQKNQRLAMRALARVYGDRDDWHLFLHGDGPDDAMLRREVARLHITERVKFLGDKLNLATLLPAMDMFVIPSNWERLPTAMGDAMLLGIPVVSAPWDGYSEFLIDGETGFVASDWSNEAFAEAIERVLADPERAKRVASRARIFAAERFDMDAAARKHAEFYYELLRRSRR